MLSSLDTLYLHGTFQNKTLTTASDLSYLSLRDAKINPSIWFFCNQATQWKPPRGSPSTLSRNTSTVCWYPNLFVRK